jgi:hypothetical protein
MPYVSRPKHPHGRLVGLMAATVLALFGIPAVAQAACPAMPLTKAFSVFGDTRDYSLLSNGAFEAGTGGWSLTNAWVADGNEGWKVRSPIDSKALWINPTGRVVSPSFCVSIDHPTFRFFARRTSNSWGVLDIRLRWSLDGGPIQEVLINTTSVGTNWEPTASFKLAEVTGLWNTSQLVTAQIILDPNDTGGGYAVDDVFIDPYTRG